MDKLVKKINEKPILFFCIILIIQLGVMVFWSCKKSNYYWDEYYTFNDAHYMTLDTPSLTYVFDTEEAQSDGWVDMSVLKEGLTVTRENSILNDGWENIKFNILKRPYWFFVAVMEAFFFSGVISKWSAILLNLFFFVICQVFVYKIAKYVTNDTVASLLTMLMFGLCGETISMVVFVRFYVMTFTFLAIATYLHALMWEDKKWYLNLIYEAIFGLIFLYVRYNSELVNIYVAVLFGCFTIGLLVKKRWIQFCYYSLPLMIGGFGYVYLKTDYVQAFFTPAKVVEAHAAAQDAEYWLVDAYNTFSKRELVRRLKENTFPIMGKFLFGHVAILVIVAIIFITLAVLCLIKFRKELKNETTHLQENKGKQFYYVIFGTAAGYGIFSILLCFWVIRYYSLFFPAMVITVICGLWLMCEYLGKRNLGIVGISVMILTMILFTSLTPQIENVYAEDKEVLDKVSKLTDSYDTVTNSGYFVLQESVVWSSENVKFLNKKDRNWGELPLEEGFLLWSSGEISEEDIEELNLLGYKYVELLGNTYISHIYRVDK